MNRVLLVFFVVFAFAARSDGLLKCYMCESLTDPTCGDPIKDGKKQLMECNVDTMIHLHREIENQPLLRGVAGLFEVDRPQYRTQLTDVACAKINLKVGATNVTFRSCQSATTPTVDTCRAIKEKLAESRGNIEVPSYCGLCYTDGCNGATDIAAPKMLQLLFGAVGLMVLQAFRHSFA